MNIIKAIGDQNLFRPFLAGADGDLSTWVNWRTALKCLYGLPIKTDEERALVKLATGRDASELPKEGFRTGLFLVGRRSGKSRIAAVIGGYEALFAGHEKRLAAGEKGLLPVVSPSKFQSGIVFNYLQAIFKTPVLEAEVAHVKESDKAITLRNGIEVRVLTDDPKTVRGPTLVSAVVDEICHLGLDSEAKCKSDTELVRSLKPGLATTQGRLIGISSKYATRGWAYSQWLRQHGSNKGVSPSYLPKWTTLVWDTDSRTMNPTLSQAEVDAAYAEDPTAAASEFGGLWRTDVAEYIPRSLVEALVVVGMKERMVRPSISYTAFYDGSGGRSDPAALCLGHLEGSKVVQDLLRVWPAPHNPHLVIAEMAEVLKRFGLRKVVGDNFGAEFVAAAFRSHGIAYTKSDFPKSQLYLELLPRLCSGGIELLDQPLQTDQLSSLERRTRSGGKDIIDHPPKGHDDAANVLAGMSAHCVARKIRIGGMW